jgi:hypothetical protein
VILAAAPAARAQGPRTDIEAMNRLMRDLRYEEVVERGLRTLRAAGPLSPRELVPIYRLLGTAYFLLGDEVHARAALVALFALDPDVQKPDDGSPKLRQFFERVRLEAAQVALDPAPLTEVAEGRPVVVEARLQGATPHVDRVFVHYRTQGTGAYLVRRLEPRGGRLLATLPGVLLVDGMPRNLEYFLEARDSAGAPIALVGTEAAPLRARVIPQRRDPPPAAAEPQAPAPSPPPEAPPIYRRWWFWGLVGVAAAGAGAALYFGTRGGASPGLDICVGFIDRPCPSR